MRGLPRFLWGVLNCDAFGVLVGHVRRMIMDSGYRER